MPLAINLDRRAAAELQSQALISAQTIAASIGAENLTPARLPALQTSVLPRIQAQVHGRVIVVDDQGILVADSAGTGFLGTDYATSLRPEIGIALGGTPHAEIRTSVTLGEGIIAAAAPIIDEGKILGAVRLTRGAGEVTANVRRIVIGLIAIGLAGLAAGVLIAIVLARSLSRPINRLAAAARRLGKGDLAARVGPTTGPREIEDLAGSFDEMAGRLESTVRAQREFVANASHQLRTPLTGMKLRLESAAAKVPTELKPELDAAEHEVDRLSAIIDRLLETSREIEQGKGSAVDLAEAVARARERWEARAAQVGASISVGGDDCRARCEARDLDQILDNLIDNALAYAPGPVDVSLVADGDRCIIAVEDRGPGIPAHEIERVTERFYRGRGSAPGGSGLGLAIVRALVERWQGSVTLTPREGGGTRVEVRLRAARAGSVVPVT